MISWVQMPNSWLWHQPCIKCSSTEGTQSCPGPSLSLEGLRTPSVPYPMPYQLLITAGKQTKTEQKTATKNKQTNFFRGSIILYPWPSHKPMLCHENVGHKKEKKSCNISVKFYKHQQRQNYVKHDLNLWHAFEAMLHAENADTI